MSTRCRSILISDDLWARAQAAAVRLSNREQRPASVSELVRRGLEREIEQADEPLQQSGSGAG